MKLGDLVRVTKHGSRNYSMYKDRVGIILNLDYGYPKVLVNGRIVHFGDGEMSLEVIR